MYTIGEFARLIGKSASCVRLWDNIGILRPAIKTAGGHRRYSEDQLTEYRKGQVISKMKYILWLSDNEISKEARKLVADGYEILSGMDSVNRVIEILMDRRISHLIIVEKEKRNTIDDYCVKILSAMCKYTNVETKLCILI